MGGAKGENRASALIAELLRRRDAGVDTGRKCRRFESVAAVENDSAHVCLTAKLDDGALFPDQPRFRREALECDPTWRCGPKSVDVC